MGQLFFLYNKINIILYCFQHSLYVNLSFNDEHINLLNLLSLFLIGILTSLTPCFISILPVVISSTSTFLYLNLLTKIMLFMGLKTSFILIITFLYLGNSQLSHILNNIPFISSLIFISLSLNLLGVINLGFYSKNLNFKNGFLNNMYVQAYLSGFICGLSSLPCNSSIILTTILWVYNSNRILNSLIYLLIYLLGCLLPFFCIFLLPFKLRPFKKFIYFWNYLISFGGFYMLTFGFFTFFKQLL